MLEELLDIQVREDGKVAVNLADIFPDSESEKRSSYLLLSTPE